MSATIDAQLGVSRRKWVEAIWQHSKHFDLIRRRIEPVFLCKRSFIKRDQPLDLYKVHITACKKTQNNCIFCLNYGAFQSYSVHFPVAFWLVYTRSEIVQHSRYNRQDVGQLKCILNIVYGFLIVLCSLSFTTLFKL